MIYSKNSTWAIAVIFLLLASFSSSFQRTNLRTGFGRRSTKACQNFPSPSKSRIINRHRSYDSVLQMEIMNLGDDSEEDVVEAKTHGYEGDFRVGDVVKVNIHTTLFHVIKYRKDGFDPYGFIGTVSDMALYGRKKKTLCSAITPVKVTFEPDGGRGSYPEDMFDKKFVAHFSGEELELIERP